MSISPSDMSKPDSARSGRILRHKPIDRVYHWLMAISVLILMVTAFLPILGWKFEWLDLHWITGVVLTLAVLFHIIRAIGWQDFWAMFINSRDLRDLTAGGKPGKYTPAQKLYHLGVSLLILAAIGTGLLMLLKIDTPWWRRDPYWFSDTGWGVIYAIHGFAAMALVTMVMIHIYFALRPDEWRLTRSMFRGWITSKEYLDHHDPKRWQAKEDA
jgi:cytochrome b subunit of formate dehydrogenase